MHPLNVSGWLASLWHGLAHGLHSGWKGLQGYDWGAWFMSPGFAGTAAVLAALLAFTGVSRTVRNQRETSRKEQWWDITKWALDLTLSEEPTTRTIGLEVLDAMGRSASAGKHELEVIEAAIAPTLEAYADIVGATYDEDPATDAAAAGDAHLQQDAPTEGDQR